MFTVRQEKYNFIFILFFLIGSYHATQAGLRLTALIPQPPEYLRLQASATGPISHTNRTCPGIDADTWRVVPNAFKETLT